MRPMRGLGEGLIIAWLVLVGITILFIVAGNHEAARSVGFIAVVVWPNLIALYVMISVWNKAA